MWTYPLVLNILFLPFYQSYQSFFIALGCLFALVRKMQSLDFKLQNHIVLLNIKSAWDSSVMVGSNGNMDVFYFGIINVGMRCFLFK